MAARGIIIILLSCLILSGCGGGGGSKSPIDGTGQTQDDINNGDPGGSDTTPDETGKDIIDVGNPDEEEEVEEEPIVDTEEPSYKITHLVGGVSNACGYGLNEVRCWGDNTEQQLSINGEKAVSEVEIGLKHICIISDGFVDCVGEDTYNQATPPTDLLNPHSLSLGNHHSCVIDRGSIRCWGRDLYGLKSDIPSVITPIALASGSYHSCVLHKSGVTCWGRGDEGQTKVPPTIIKPRAIFAEANHTCALQEEKVICWGASATGQLELPDQLSSTQQMALGDTHSCALDKNGVTCWGDNQYDKSTAPESLTDASAIAVSKNFSCALIKGEILCWGSLNPLMTIAEGTTLNFPQLTQIVGIYGELDLANDSTLNMPLLTLFKDQKVFINGSGNLITGQLTNLDNTRWTLTGGAVFGGGSIAPGSQLLLSTCCNGDGISVSGEGSLLDLSNLSKLTVGYNGYKPMIKATSEGALDLSGVTHIVNKSNDKAELILKTESGGSLDMNQLETIKSEGARTRLELEGTTTLPNVTRMEAANIHLENGQSLLFPKLVELVKSQVTLSGENTQLVTGALSNIDNTRWTITGGAQFGGDDIAPSTQMNLTSCCNENGILVEGEGSLLDMSNVTVLVTGHQSQKTFIEASEGGLLNLSGVTEITNSSGELGGLFFESRLAGGIHLENASTLKSTNGALSTFIAIGEGSNIDISTLCDSEQTELISEEGGSILNGC